MEIICLPSTSFRVARELRRQRNKTNEVKEFDNGTVKNDGVISAPSPQPISSTNEPRPSSTDEPPSSTSEPPSSPKIDQRKRRSRRPRDNNNNDTTPSKPTSPLAKEVSKASDTIPVYSAPEESSSPEDYKENTLGRRRRKKSSRGVERSSGTTFNRWME